MKKVLILCACGLLFIVTGCSKKEVVNTYPAPNWKIASPEKYPYSHTAIVSLPDDLNAYADEQDKIAAFINEECRGTGDLVKATSGNTQTYFLTIRGDATERGNIVFKYYSAKVSFLFVSTNSLTFQIDERTGTKDAPLKLELKNI